MMEELEIFTELGEPTGEKAPRYEIHQNGWWHQTVHVWIHSQGKLLLQKRSPKKEIHPGLWDVSSAGHIDFGEAVEAAALRETREELGLEFSPEDLHFLFRVKSEVRYKSIIDREWANVFLITLSGSPAWNANVDEVSDCRLFSISELIFKLSKESEQFVDHRGEYGQLFSYLKSLEH